MHIVSSGGCLQVGPSFGTPLFVRRITARPRGVGDRGSGIKVMRWGCLDADDFVTETKGAIRECLGNDSPSFAETKRHFLEYLARSFCRWDEPMIESVEDKGWPDRAHLGLRSSERRFGTFLV
jgi:hypothetical protein